MVRPMLHFQSEGNITATLQLCKHEHAQRVTSNNPSYDLPSSPSSMTVLLQLFSLGLMAAAQTQI